MIFQRISMLYGIALMTLSVFLTLGQSALAQVGSVENLVYQGRIANGGAPLNAGVTTFEVSVFGGASNCLLYQETFTRDMSSASGHYSLAIGSGTRTDTLFGGAAPTHSLSDALRNIGTLSTLNCGGSSGSFSPAISNDRRFQLRFNAGAGWVSLPSQAIKSSPYAMQAMQLNGYGISNVGKISGAGSASVVTPAGWVRLQQAGDTGIFTFSDDSATACAAGLTGGLRYNAGNLQFCNGTVWATLGTSGAGITALTGDVTASGTGSVAATITAGAVTSTKILDGAVTAAKLNQMSATTGQVLKWNGTVWAPAADDNNATPGDASYAAKGIVQFQTDAATSGITVAAGVARLANSGVTAGAYGSATQVPAITVDAFGRVTAVTATTIALPASAITSGTLNISQGGTGAASLTANRMVMVNGTGTAFSNDACTMNQLLQYNGTSWACVAATSLGTANAVVNNGNSYAGTMTVGTNDNNDLRFETNGTDKMTVLANGNVGIGTTSPVAQLHVEGNITSPGSGLNSEKFGFGAVASAPESVALGRNSSAAGDVGGSIAIGLNARADTITNGPSGIALGKGADASGNRGRIAIGENALANATGLAGFHAIAVGYGAKALGNDSIAIGWGADASFNHSIALGRSSKPTAQNQFVAGAANPGGNDSSFTEVYFGSGPRFATPQNYTLFGSGALGTNIAGGELQLSGGRGTGSGAGGGVAIQTAPAGGSGATQNLPVTRMYLNSSGNVGIGTTTPGAVLDITSTTSGVLIPRMTTAQRDAITSPANGLQVYNTTTSQLNYYNGSAWQALGVAGAGISSLTAGSGLTGGTITTSGTIAVDTGTTANKIVQLNASAELPAVSGVNLTALNASNIASGTLAAARLPNSGVTAGAYGSATQVPAITVDAFGRVTAVTATTIALPASAITSGTLNISQGGTGASSLTANRMVMVNGTGTALSNDVCTVNQLLQYNGTSWACVAATSLGTANAVVNNGNSYAGTMTVGTNDNNELRFETNGTDKMTVLANGNVGIGTITPQEALHVVGNITSPGTGGYSEKFGAGASVGAQNYSTAVGNSATSTGAEGTAVGYGSTASEYNTALGAGSSSTGGAFSVAIGKNATTTGSHSVALGQGATAANTAIAIGKSVTASNNQLNIGNILYGNMSTGNVGIGTTSPRSRLEVAGGIQIADDAATCDATKVGTIRYNSSTIQFCNGSTWAGMGGGAGAVSNGGNSFAGTMTIGTNDNNPLRFETNGTDKMTVLANGNVGIGTTNPDHPIEASTTATGGWTPVAGFFAPNNTGIGAATQMRFGVSQSGRNSAEWRFVYAGNSSASNRQDFAFYGDAQPVVSMQAGGNVGIGTTTPSSLLHVSDALSPFITVTDTTNNLNALIQATDTVAYFGQTGGAYSVGFTTSGVERMRINASGNVGIATTAPDAKLVVNNNSASTLPAAPPQSVARFVGADGQSARLSIEGFGTGWSTGVPSISQRRANGTAAAPSALVSGDMIGNFNFLGYGSTGFTLSRATMQVLTTENWTDTANGTSFVFATTPNGSTVPQERMRIDHSGNIGIGISSPTERLDVTGNVRVVGQAYSATQTSSATTPLTFNPDNGSALEWSIGSQTNIVLNIHNMKNSAAYTVAIRGTGVGSTTINCFSDAGSTPLTLSQMPAAANRAATGTIFSIQRIGSYCYASWSTGWP